MSGWKISTGLSGIALTVLVALGGGCAREAAPAAGAPMLRLSQRNEPAALDPHLATLPDEFFIIRALSEGLLVPAPGGGPPEPAAAESWSVSPDGLTWTFRLRAGARWSNGDPVRAADFVYSIRRALTPTLAAPKAALFFPLRGGRNFYLGKNPDFSAVGARAVDDRTLALTLEAPLAEFARFGAIDQRSSAWTRPGNFVGNGPFVLTAWQPNQLITVRANPAYHDAARVHVGEIRFVAFDNGDGEERAFRGGQLDVTMAVPVSKLDPYRAASPAVLQVLPLHETRYLSLNPSRPPLGDRRVRQALSLALNRAELVEKVLRGGQRAAYNFVPPGLGGYLPDERLAENAAAARHLLAEAGYPDGRGFPRLELSSWTTTPVLLEAIQQTWHRELGIDVALVQREARTHLAALVAGDYDLALATAIPDYNGTSDLLGALKTGDAGNYPRFADARFDRLVDAGARAATPTDRTAAYRQAEQVLLEELPLIPLYFNSQNFLLRPGVKHWQTDSLWTRFYRDLAVE